MRASRCERRQCPYLPVWRDTKAHLQTNLIPLARSSGDVHPARTAFADRVSSPERMVKAGVQPLPNPLFTFYISAEHRGIGLNFITVYKSRELILPCCGLSEMSGAAFQGGSEEPPLRTY